MVPRADGEGRRLGLSPLVPFHAGDAATLYSSTALITRHMQDSRWHRRMVCAAPGCWCSSSNRERAHLRLWRAAELFDSSVWLAFRTGSALTVRVLGGISRSVSAAGTTVEAEAGSTGSGAPIPRPELPGLPFCALATSARRAPRRGEACFVALTKGRPRSPARRRRRGGE